MSKIKFETAAVFIANSLLNGINYDIGRLKGLKVLDDKQVALLREIEERVADIHIGITDKAQELLDDN